MKKRNTKTSILKRLLYGGAEVEVGSVDEKRLFFMNSFSFTGMLIGLVFLAVYYLHGVSGWIFYSSYSLLGLLILQIILRVTHNVSVSLNIAALFVAVALMYLYLTGGVDGGGIFWTMIFPVVVLSLVGKRKALYWIAAFLVTMLVFALFGSWGILDLVPYSMIVIFQFLSTIVIISFFGFIYITRAEDALREVKKSRKEADEVNIELSDKVKQVKSTEADLAERNKVLGNTKRAMINLLEDARELEGELVKEKSLVEQKVAERTKQLADAKNKISEGWLQQREEKARLVASINSLPLGFFLLDNQHNVLTFNDALKKIFDIEGEVNYEVLSEVFEKCGVDIKLVCNHCKGNLESFEKSDVSYHDKFLRFFSTPAVENDKLIGFVVSIEDTTEAKLLERAKEEFFSIASHELRTPLTAIRGNAAMMREYFGEVLGKNQDMSEMVDDMHSASVRLIGIVNDFLDSSRLEQGRMVFKKEKFDLVKVVDDVVESIGVNAKERKIVLKRQEVNVKFPQVLADAERTQQILYNIIGNAVSYTKQGGVIVNISQAGSSLKVRVADTGVGITPQNQRLLFRKFQQAGERVLARDVTKGTGLGLYISRLLAKGMGGDVMLEKSEIGKGSIFAIILPVVK